MQCTKLLMSREGLLLEAMSPTDRALDPLVEGCYWLGARHGISERMGPPLEAWLKPLWGALEPLFPPGRDDILLAAACRLCDLGARLHPDHRADLAFDQVLRAPIAGQSHAERAFLAAAVFSRYTAQSQTRDGSGIARLLSPDRLRRARALGAALRLGCDLSGRSEVLLDQAALTLTPQGVELSVRRERADMVLGEQTRKRLAGLAEVASTTTLESSAITSWILALVGLKSQFRSPAPLAKEASITGRARSNARIRIGFTLRKQKVGRTVEMG